ncbi:hypothetical protein [Sphingomonas sp.]|uniref:hypothetical protein n=1 Tax=Sphingomonas sp. TaxID=28214 RepID=UPI0031D52B97
MGGLVAHSGIATLAASEAALRAWAFEAQPGARVVFATGQEPPRDQPVWTAARRLVDMGLIRTFHPRRADGKGFDYVAQRLPSPVAIHDNASREARVFAEIERCLSIGEPLPTDRQLALRCGLRHADEASYALRKLRARTAGDRRIAIINHGPTEHRQAIVLSTGRMTIRKGF